MSPPASLRGSDVHVAPGSWREYACDPLPGWGGRTTSVFGEPSGTLGEGAADIAFASVSLDSTSMSRPGARFGPREIRQASQIFASQAASRGDAKLMNLRTGQLVTPSTSHSVVDYGDLHVYPTDMERQVRAVAAETMRLSLDHRLLVLLGGEHLVSFPSFVGVAEAARERGSKRLGYLQIDHHFDFGDTAELYGTLYHGSNARRISEHSMSTATTRAFVGAGDVTAAAQLEALRSSGTIVKTMADIRNEGFAASVESAISALRGDVDELYVSIDIDVCDAAFAPGTGHVTVGGISSTDFLDLPRVLNGHRDVIRAIDVVEVSPPYDPAGITSHLVARMLFELLYYDTP